MEPNDNVPLAEPIKEDAIHPIPPGMIVLLCACFVPWVISFFLSAATVMNWGQEQIAKGYELALSAAIFFWTPVYGWSFFANVFMLIAPFEIKRVSKGKGRVFACLFFMFALVPMAIAFPARELANPGAVRTLHAGFYVWQISLLAAATWFMCAAWRNSYLALAGALLIGLVAYAPTYQNRIHFREVVEKTRAVIDALGVPGKSSPIGDLNMAAYRDLWRLRNNRARAELILAVDYTQNAVGCWDRERISDLRVAQMFPSLHLHSPDPGRAPQAPPPGRDATGCYEDNSATRPWYSGDEMRPEALRLARLHLANAEIEIGLKTGGVQEPFPLSPHESFILGHAMH
jgi:hypothetical protein